MDEGPKEVEIGLMIMDLLGIDDAAETFTIDVQLTMLWMDEALGNTHAKLKLRRNTLVYKRSRGQRPGDKPRWTEMQEVNIQTDWAELLNERGAEGEILNWHGPKHFTIRAMVTRNEFTEDYLEVFVKGEHFVIPKWCLLATPHYEVYDVWEEKKEYFFPTYSFQNLQDDVKEIFQTRTLTHCDEAGGYVFFKRRFIATFKERLELKHFPYDRQLFQIKISCELPRHQCKFKLRGGQWTNCNVVSTRKKLNFVDEGQWTIKQCENRVLDDDADKGMPRSNFRCILAGERKKSFYEVNFWILYVLTLVSFFCSWIDDFPNRLQAQVGFLFTTMSWKQTVDSWLPRKPYLTRMDWYVLAAFGAQVNSIVCTWLEYGSWSVLSCSDTMALRFVCTVIESFPWSGARWLLSCSDNIVMTVWFASGVVVTARSLLPWNWLHLHGFGTPTWWQVYAENLEEKKMKTFWSYRGEWEEETSTRKRKYDGRQPSKWWEDLMGPHEESFDNPSKRQRHHR